MNDEQIKQEYLKSQGLLSTDIGSRLALIRAIQKIQKDRGKSTKGFTKFNTKVLKGIYYNLIN